MSKASPGFRTASAVVAGNLAVFVFAATALTTGWVAVSHHWLFPFHMALLLAQAFLLSGPLVVRPLAGISLHLLGIAIIRIETIWLAHHLVHFAVAFAGGAILHAVLSRRPGAPWRRFNLMFAILCAVTGLVSAVASVRQGIWWGLGGG
jgi:hypothetical protein